MINSQNKHDEHREGLYKTLKILSPTLHLFTSITDFSDIAKIGTIASNLFCILYITNSNIIIDALSKDKIYGIENYMINANVQISIMHHTALKKAKNMHENIQTIFFQEAINCKFITKDNIFKISDDLINFLEKDFTDLKEYEKYLKLLEILTKDIRQIVYEVKKENNCKFLKLKCS